MLGTSECICVDAHAGTGLVVSSWSDTPTAAKQTGKVLEATIGDRHLVWHSGVLRSSCCGNTSYTSKQSWHALVSTPTPRSNSTPLRRKGSPTVKELGRVRTMETRVMWLQQAVRWRVIELETVPSVDVLADLGAKTLRVDRSGEAAKWCGAALNKADVLESELAVRKLDRIDTREDVNACLEQMYAP